MPTIPRHNLIPYRSGSEQKSARMMSIFQSLCDLEFFLPRVQQIFNNLSLRVPQEGQIIAIARDRPSLSDRLVLTKYSGRHMTVLDIPQSIQRSVINDRMSSFPLELPTLHARSHKKAR